MLIVSDAAQPRLADRRVPAGPGAPRRRSPRTATSRPWGERWPAAYRARGDRGHRRGVLCRRRPAPRSPSCTRPRAARRAARDRRGARASACSARAAAAWPPRPGSPASPTSSGPSPCPSRWPARAARCSARRGDRRRWSTPGAAFIFDTGLAPPCAARRARGAGHRPRRARASGGAPGPTRGGWPPWPPSSASTVPPPAAAVVAVTIGEPRAALEAQRICAESRRARRVLPAAVGAGRPGVPAADRPGQPDRS